MSALQLYTPLSDPPFSVVVLHKVVFCKCGYIGKGQPGEGCEDKNVAHQCQAGDGEFFLHDAFQFRIGQEYGVGFVLCHLVAVERVLAHPFLGQCHVCNPFETFHVTDNRVPAETGFRFQVQVECGNKIGIQITYDEEDKNILRLYIPKLIMQPVVENAIYHGIEQKLGAGQVTISISYTKQNLDIMISDDGIGIKDTELSEINNRLWTDSENYGYEKSEKSGGIAIRNVNQRIKLLFGEEYGIWLNSIYGIGTDVHIKLPVVLTPDDLEKKLRIDKEDVGGQSGKGTCTL